MRRDGLDLKTTTGVWVRQRWTEKTITGLTRRTRKPSTLSLRHALGCRESDDESLSAWVIRSRLSSLLCKYSHTYLSTASSKFSNKSICKIHSKRFHIGWVRWPWLYSSARWASFLLTIALPHSTPFDIVRIYGKPRLIVHPLQPWPSASDIDKNYWKVNGSSILASILATYIGRGQVPTEMLKDAVEMCYIRWDVHRKFWNDNDCLTVFAPIILLWYPLFVPTTGSLLNLKNTEILIKILKLLSLCTVTTTHQWIFPTPRGSCQTMTLSIQRLGHSLFSVLSSQMHRPVLGCHSRQSRL